MLPRSKSNRHAVIEDEVHTNVQVPLSDDEIADIHSAYRDCAIRAASKSKRKPHRPANNCKKKTEFNSSSNAIEIIYHDQSNDTQLVADPWRLQEFHDEPEVWSIQWDEDALNGNSTLYLEEPVHWSWIE